MGTRRCGYGLSGLHRSKRKSDLGFHVTLPCFRVDKVPSWAVPAPVAGPQSLLISCWFLFSGALGCHGSLHCRPIAGYRWSFSGCDWRCHVWFSDRCSSMACWRRFLALGLLREIGDGDGAQADRKVYMVVVDSQAGSLAAMDRSSCFVLLPLRSNVRFLVEGRCRT